MTFPLKTIDIEDSLYGVEKATFRLVPDQETSGGEWSPGMRVGGPRSMRWRCSLTMRPYQEHERMRWDIMVARAQGGLVAVRLHHPAHGYPRGVGSGIFQSMMQPTSLGGKFSVDDGYLLDGVHYIDGGSTIAYVAADAPRYADAIHMAGLWPSSRVFLAGDHFETGGNLYMVADDCLSDANGECMVPFLWRLWKPALAGDRINLHKPSGRFVFAARDTGEQVYNGSIGTATLQAVEIPEYE